MILSTIHSNLKPFFPFFKIRKLNAQARRLIINSCLQKRLKRQRDITYSTIAFISVFFLCWTPYAVICIHRMIWGDSNMNPYISALPTMFAKLSFVAIPILYILLNKHIKTALVKNNKREKSNKDKSFEIKTKSLKSKIILGITGSAIKLLN